MQQYRSQHKRFVQRWLSDLNNPLSLGHLQASLHDARLIADLSRFFTVYFTVVKTAENQCWEKSWYFLGEIMVLSHGNHGNFSKKLTCFLNPNQEEKPKCQDFSEKYSLSGKREHAFFSLTQIFLTTCGVLYCYYNKDIHFSLLSIGKTIILFQNV